MIIEILFFHLHEGIREAELPMFGWFRCASRETGAKFLDRWREEEKRLHDISTMFEKRFQMNHSLGVHDIERILSHCHDPFQFAKSRSVVIPMHESVLDHISRVDAGLEILPREKIIMSPFFLALPSRTSRSGDNLLQTIGMLRMKCLPNGRLPDSGGSGKYADMGSGLGHRMRVKNSYTEV